MLCQLLIPLILQAGLASAQQCDPATCIGSADAYMAKLKDLFGGGSDEGCLCEGSQLMARIQNFNGIHNFEPEDVQSLKYVLLPNYNLII